METISSNLHLPNFQILACCEMRKPGTITRPVSGNKGILLQGLDEPFVVTQGHLICVWSFFFFNPDSCCLGHDAFP